MPKVTLNLRNVRWIFLRELRDQLRDRRTLFTIFVLPMLLYPLLGMSFLQITQFTREQPTSVALLGHEELPESPRLLTPDGTTFDADLSVAASANWIRLTPLESVPSQGSDEKAGERLPPGDSNRDQAERLIRSGQYDVVVRFPPDFGERLNAFRRALHERAASGSGTRATSAEPAVAGAPAVRLDDDPTFRIPEPELFVDTANDKSRVAFDRVERILHRWRQRIVEDNLRESRLPVMATAPFQVAEHDIAKESRRRAAVWSKILPFVVLVWALTGAFYPAIDLCAGEKERGTLETLLSSPAERSEIVWGKLLTVMTFSMGTSILNLFSMGLTGAFIMGQLQRMGPALHAVELGRPPLYAFAWLLVILVPVSGLFSALSLAIATFARSSKEGQYYLMPLLMISLPLMLLPILPSTELDLGTSLIPITGMMLLLRALIEGQFADALRFCLPVVGVTSLGCLFAIRWAIQQFNNEAVLFRDSERFGMGIWLRHLVRDRQAMPSIGQAVLCGLLLLLIHFFASLLVVAPPASWRQFASLTLINLIAFIATPALLMAIVLTRNPRDTLRLRWPQPWSLPAAVLLAVCVHPVGMALATGVQRLYPVSPDVAQQLGQIGSLLGQAPNLWIMLGVLALAPAICEEFAFRGFILSGLGSTGHKWFAIAVSSLFFGATHGLLQQSLTAAALGLVIGYVAVQTGSLLPGMLFHACYNALGVLLTHGSAELSAYRSNWSWLFSQDGAATGYTFGATIVGGLLSVLLLAWFQRLRPTDAVRDDAPAPLDVASASAVSAS